MMPSIPTVKISHYTDTLCIGRPNRKAGACHSIDRARMRPQLFKDPPLIAAPKEK